MKMHRGYLLKKGGMTTVELIIILAALVSVALIYRDNLNGFTNRVVNAEFNQNNSVEIMTFGGKVKASPKRSAGAGEENGSSSGLGRVIERTVITPIKGLFSAGRAMPVEAVIRNDPSNRNQAALNAVVDQFAVETEKRYQPGLFSTYCNIFVWDVTTAMNAEIPHWINRKTNMPYQYNQRSSYSENARQAIEMNVNTLYDWMPINAAAIGYREVGEQEARAAANRGLPAVAIWKNPQEGSSGHIVVLRPYDTSYGGDLEETYVAQAGRRPCKYIPLNKVFNRDKMNTLRFYVHD